MTAVPPSAIEHARDEAQRLVAGLEIVLPPECVAGVLQNAALLAAHWENIRGFADGGPSA